MNGHRSSLFGAPLFSLPRPLRRLLLKGYPLWRRAGGGEHRLWNTPSGHIYLNACESPMMLARILGLYESNKFEFLDQHLKPGMTFLDIGSNKGDFAFYAARRVGSSGRVIAFEPEPQNASWIAASRATGDGTNLEIERVALAETDRGGLLHLGVKSGWHSLVDGLDDRTETDLEVEVRALDSVLSDLGWPQVDVMKIDVEGAETQVLEGAAELFRRSKKLVAMVDLHPRHGVSVAAFLTLADSLGLRARTATPPYEELSAPADNLEELLLEKV